jgi:NNP family nitrate/nitrite transporter-like MFS transporter
MAKTPERWEVDDPQFWEETGKSVANRNLWISIPNLLCGFAVWIYWGMIAKTIQKIHFGSGGDLFQFAELGLQGGDAYRAKLFLLPAVAGLAGATLRIPNSFMIAICGGRNVKFMTTIMLIVPAVAAGFALQNHEVPFMTLVILAAMSGVGGGAFSSSMSNISFFFPKKMQGLSLGLNAGLGNFGVSVMQFLIPWAITFGMFGGLGGDGYTFGTGEAAKTVWVQNAALVWVPPMIILAVAAFFGMNNLPQHKCGPTPVAIAKYLWLTVLGFAGAAVGIFLLVSDWGGVPELLKTFVVVVVAVLVTLALMKFATPGDTKEKLNAQFAIFRNKHNWIMTWLYVMTFGSFIGYANAFPKLIDDIFGVIRVDAATGQALAEGLVNPNAPISSSYIWIGAGVGALIRPVGGWLSDKIGGAKVTLWDTWIMVAATIAAGYFVAMAKVSPTPEQYFMPFLISFIILFATTGIGNGSTFRMIPIIFSKEQAGPVLGWTAAIAAYGAFLIPKIVGTQIKNGTPEYALYGFAAYYATCIVVCWWFYARKNAEVPC